MTYIPPLPPLPRACAKCGSLECGPVRCRFEDPAKQPTRGPAFDEGLPPKFSAGCARTECPSWWNCQLRGCYISARAAYGDVMVKRDKERWYTSTEWDTDTSGAPLRGSGSREEKHRQHQTAIKDGSGDRD